MIMNYYKGRKEKKARAKENRGEPLDYKQNHMRDFLLTHPAISVTLIEMLSKVPTGTVRHFKKNRREIPSKHVESVEIALSEYGFIPLNDE